MLYRVIVNVARNPAGDLFRVHLCANWRRVRAVLRAWKHRPITIIRHR